jgi:peptidoglycan/LPS O-acetylase OafA/YrhL
MMTIGSGLFRLFLAAVVVVHHSFPLRLGAWAVYVFFILSGFWISQMWQQRYAHTHNPLLTFIVSRWWRLAPLFLVCTALSVVSNLLLSGGDPLHGGHGATWWLRQLPIADSSGVGTDLPPTWSLDVEMQFYLVAPLLITVFGRIRPLLRCLIAVVGCGWFALHILRGGNIQLATLPLFVGFFLIGVTMQWGQWKSSRTLANGSLLIFFAVTVLLAIWPQTRRGVWRAGADTALIAEDFSGFVAGVWWIIGAALVVPFLAWNVAQKSPRFDRFLSDLAYPVYLFHWIPREWYYHFSLRSDPVWKQCLLLAMNFLAVAAGAMILLLVVDQPSERLRAAWVSRRKKNRRGQEMSLAVNERDKGFG